jgi:predicted TIM-barrel fold metal-dependent hydrolase
LYTDPTSLEFADVLKSIKNGQAISYSHIEHLNRTDLRKLDPLFSLSSDRGFPVILHLSHHDSKTFRAKDAAYALELITKFFPKLIVIVSHMGGENLREAIRWAQVNPNLLLDTSRLTETSQRARMGCVQEVLQWVKETVPSNCILYGSDSIFPAWRDNKQNELATIQQCFANDDLDDILWKNALNLNLPNLDIDLSLSQN